MTELGPNDLGRNDLGRNDLGMLRPIARRDFLNGLAIGITAGVSALSSAQAQNAVAENDPPARTGLRGNYPAAVDDFDALIREGASDADLTRYFDERVSDAQRDAANRYVLDDMKSHLDKQDAEEGRL